MWSRYAVLSILLLLLVTLVSAQPRIGNLWGGGPEARDFDKWAKYDLLVFAGGGPEAWRTFSREVRKRNPDIKLLGTAPLMNLIAPESTPWMQRDWFLKRPDGELVTWWADLIYAPNLFNDDCLNALVEQSEQQYGDLVDEGAVDGIFYDSVVGRVSWYGEVDTDGDGQADAPGDVNQPWLDRQNLFFDRLREKHPGILILANDVDEGHAPHINGRLFEGGPLLDRLLTGSLGAGEAASILDTWMTTSLQPGLTFAIMTHPLGWQGWRVGKGDRVSTPGEVDRVRRDFSRMRLGLTTALMTDAYYAYDFGTVWYGLPFWYAEYDAPLGKPLGPAREVFSVPPVTFLDWEAGQDADALILDPSARVTPEGIQADVPEPDAPWQRLFATDFRKVRFEPGKVYRVEAVCTVTASPGHAFQVSLRTAKGGWKDHDKGVTGNDGETGSIWRIECTIIPDDFDDYGLEWHCLGGGGLRLERLRVELVDQSYFVREFEGGMVALNTLPMPISVKLERPMRRLTDDVAPRHVIEVDDIDRGFVADGAWEQAAGEKGYYGRGFCSARKPGESARWRFTAPAADTYTILATMPGGKDLTDAAEYSVTAPAGGPSVTVDQRSADGGWVELFDVELAAGEECEILLRSAGAGATVADAIRAESATRYNDGSTVDTLDLAGLDGVVLLTPEDQPAPVNP